ncbi:MAG: glycosyltransferase family 9 protein [Candidatus Omnitrophica bacterium]|nr:glycosyltransferase family 9 protein [Candidatus Omnitrophota bacterium]
MPKLNSLLVTRTDRLGDLVLSTPVFEAIRSQFPKAHLACLTFLENHEVLEGNPFIDEVILYDKKGSEKGWWGNLRFARQLSKKRFDAVIHLHPTNRMHLMGWLARIPVRIGYQKKNDWALTHTLKDRKKEGLKHEAEYNFDLLKFLGVEAPQKLETYFPLKEKDRASLDFLLRNLVLATDKPYVVLNPSASCPSKIWHAERFASLSDELQKKYRVQVALIGSRQDRPLAKKVMGYTSERVIDLSGKLSLGMLGWLLKRSVLLISNDSGPVHVGRAVGIPVISIFGRNLSGLSPRRWGPLGEGGRIIHKEVACPVCLAHQCQINFLCLDAIAVKDVLKEAATFLQSS